MAIIQIHGKFPQICSLGKKPQPESPQPKSDRISGFPSFYPRVIKQFAIEHDHRNSGSFAFKKWWIFHSDVKSLEGWLVILIMFFFFPIQLGIIIIPTDLANIFQRGRLNHQPDMRCNIPCDLPAIHMIHGFVRKCTGTPKLPSLQTWGIENSWANLRINLGKNGTLGLDKSVFNHIESWLLNLFGFWLFCTAVKLSRLVSDVFGMTIHCLKLACVCRIIYKAGPHVEVQLVYKSWICLVLFCYCILAITLYSLYSR